MNNINIKKETKDKILSHDEIIEIISKKRDKIETIFSWEDLPDPDEFKDMKKARTLFTQTINRNKKIFFVHDSDVDGFGGYIITRLFLSYFSYKNVEVHLVIREEGYGFIPKHLIGLEKDDLVITADNGITSHEACDIAHQKGIKVIITDHHQVDKNKGLPDADAIINPHQDDCNMEFKEINGTFVYWYFIKSIVQEYGISMDMKWFLPELMLTTISDVMPLHGPNRFVVKEGLAQLENYRWKKWLDIYMNKSKEKITAESLAFGFIPSLNAASRLTKPDDALRVFLNAETIECDKSIQHCETLNNLRKELQQNLIFEIKKNYSLWLNFDFIVIPGTSNVFRKGLLGPISGRLAEEFKKPCIVLTKSKDGKSFSGSGRSIGNIDILGILKTNPYIIQDKTGGHKAACGVSVLSENFENFWKHLQIQTAKIPKEEYIKEQYILGKIEMRDINLELFEKLEQFEPYGKDFERPVFITRGKIKSLRKIGKDKNHYSMEITDELGTIHRVMWFFFTEEIVDKSKRLSFTFTIHRDSFQDKDNVVLFIKSTGSFEDWVN